MPINSLPHEKILDWSKLKAFADGIVENCSSCNFSRHDLIIDWNFLFLLLMMSCIKDNLAWKDAFVSVVCLMFHLSAAYNGGRRHLCEEGSIRLSNVDETGIIYSDLSSNDASYDNPCIVRIESCSACQVEIRPEPARDFEFFCNTGVLQNTYCSLGCDYLHIFDMYYMNESQTAKYYKKWSEFTQPYVSESSNIFIMLCHGNSGRYNFSLSYKTIKKSKEYIGTYNNPSLQRGIVLSPFFPRGYYLNHEAYEYTIRGIHDKDRIMLIFNDWNLHTSSAFFYRDKDNDGSFTGSASRPSLVTESNELKLVFHTGQSLSPTYGRNFMGFKATYTFHHGDSVIHKPLTECMGSGYFLSQEGGHIQLSHTAVREQLYDCVWVVKRQPGYTGIYLKITSLKIRRSYIDGRLVIRSGLTSDSKVAGNISLNDDIDAMHPYLEPEGFYIQLTATLHSSESVELAFASYKDTTTCHREDGMFECDSRKCISNKLTCDGYDHCGDDSDESKACGVYTPPWDQSYQYTITIGVIVPMVISVFLVMVICLLFVLIRRCRRQRLEAQRSPDRIHTLSEEVSPTRNPGHRRRRRRRRRMFNASTDRDNPPTYDEAIQSPPSWFLNVGFSNPADPNLPQPPPYSEVAESQATGLTNAATGSPVSSHSSQSEVTIDSRRHSVSSSSSDGGFRDWNTHESDTEGRRGRLGRHVSSSDDSEDEEQPRRGPARMVQSANRHDVVRNESPASLSNSNVPERNRDKGKEDNKADKNKAVEKEVFVKDKDTHIDNVVDSSNLELQGSNKVNNDIKEKKDENRYDGRQDDDRPSHYVAEGATEAMVAKPLERQYHEQPRKENHAGMMNRLNNDRRYEANGRNSEMPPLAAHRGISRSDGNLAKNQTSATRGLSERTRRSLAEQTLSEETLGPNLVVDVDTNEVRMVFDGAAEQDVSTPNGTSSRTHHSMDPVRSDYRRERNGDTGARNHSNNSDTRRRERSQGGNSRIQEEPGRGVTDAGHPRPGPDIGRVNSVNYIPIFIDGNLEEDIYV